MNKNEKINSWLSSYIKGIEAEHTKLIDSCKEMLALTEGWMIVEKEEWERPHVCVTPASQRVDGKTCIEFSVCSPAGCYEGFTEEVVDTEWLDIALTFDEIMDNCGDLELEDFDKMIEIIQEARARRLALESPENNA